MTIDKTYDPHAIETRWYAYWEEKGYFVPQGQGDAFCIMISTTQCNRQLTYGARVSGHHYGCANPLPSHER